MLRAFRRSTIKCQWQHPMVAIAKGTATYPWIYVSLFQASWRISAGVPRNHDAPKRDSREGKNWPKSFQGPPKSTQIPPQTPPKSIQMASWSLSWTNALQKLDFEGPKNVQEAAKSAQKKPQMAPDPSKIEPKTLPKLIFMRFFTIYFPI